MTQDSDIAKGDTSNKSPAGSSCRDWLIARRERLELDRTRYRRLETRWSWIRLFVFTAGVCGVVLLRHHWLPAAATGALGLLVFAVTVLRHAGFENRRVAAEWALVIVRESLHASAQRNEPVRSWQRPADPMPAASPLPTIIESGPTWPLTDQERDDLDLYARPVGIFGMLNRTSTDLGARRLRDMLDAPCLCREQIQERQHAISWLGTHHEQRLDVMAALVPLRRRSERLDKLVQLTRETICFPMSALSSGIRLWSVFSGALVVHAMSRIVAGDYAWVRAFVAVVALNSLILFLRRRMFARLRAAVSPWAELPTVLRRFLAVAECAHQELPDHTQLGVLERHFRTVVEQGRIPSLCAWLEWAGLHGMVRGLLNVTVFLDLHIAQAVLTRAAAGRDTLLQGLSAMAELEALCSLACFSSEQAVACYPQPVADAAMAVEEGRHPLILEPDAVANNIHLTADKRTWVITGPNAAGKSTFLRMVGVNVLLAQIGAAVPARRMTWSPVRLMTDVRVRDDLARNESYFLAEVRRLRRMVLDPRDSTPLLGLIDEPFRGTNSQERTAAGIALLEHLTASGNLFVVATHEEMLARVAARAASAENYHFQEQLENGRITFDYRLRPGPAGTRTAIRILEQEGYPPPLLNRARELAVNGTEITPLD